MSLLFNEEGTWMKIDGLFDVTMGAYDGAEVKSAKNMKKK